MRIERKSIRCTSSFEDGLKEFKAFVNNFIVSDRIISINEYRDHYDITIFVVWYYVD